MCLISLDKFSAFKLGEVWYKTFYNKIVESLSISEGLDRRSRDILSELMTRHTTADVLHNLSPILFKKIVFVFGAGPSLDSDIKGVKVLFNKIQPVIVAADGAADALYKARAKPTVVVSDLDSCSLRNLQLTARNGSVFVHAHGDNYELVKKILPKLGRNVFGTTQVESANNVKNFGGFTDGDRSCYVASHFSPSCIVIAGMDFGRLEGRHSKNRYEALANPKREMKMTWGRKSLEFLVKKRPDIKFLNITKSGEEIEGVSKVSYDALTSELARLFPRSRKPFQRSLRFRQDHRLSSLSLL